MEIIDKRDIRQMSMEEMEKYFLSKDMSKFRAKQIYEWLWKKGARDFESMTNLSKGVRETLKQEFVFNAIKLDHTQKSNDGTIKSRFILQDGHYIEAVLIPVVDKNRFTVCVSSQVGCSLSCSFCATGQMKIMRNLTSGEIYDQVTMVNEQCMDQFGHPITNVVYMGMGEPLLNYKNVVKSIEYLTSQKALGMANRRITISTAGISKMIKKLADDGLKVNLALSLHASSDEKRDKIMAINETNNLKVLTEALKYYYQKTKNKISFEYIAFRNFNDSIEDAENLYKLCKHFPVKVNIIEYNPVEGLPFVKSDQDTTYEFAHYLINRNVTATIRRSRGKDIDAACGQLANKGK